MEKSCKILVEITQMKRSLENPMHRWMANIKMDLLGMSM
jgi:hypothetical protein